MSRKLFYFFISFVKSMLKPHLCAYIHTHEVQEKNQLPKLECRVLLWKCVLSIDVCVHKQTGAGFIQDEWMVVNAYFPSPVPFVYPILQKDFNEPHRTTITTGTVKLESRNTTNRKIAIELLLCL